MEQRLQYDHKVSEVFYYILHCSCSCPCEKVLFYSAMPGAAAIRGRLMSIDLRLVMLGGGMVVYERAR